MFRAFRSSKFVLVPCLIAACLMIEPILAQAQEGGKPLKRLNLIARDPKGGLVTDLTVNEIEIADGGVKQEIAYFRTPAEVASGPRLVTIVFGGLSNQGRQYAKQAAKEFLRAELGKNVQASVFVVDRRLYVQESFTADVKKLEAAVDLAMSGSFEKYKKRSEEIEKLLAQSQQLEGLGQIVRDALEQSSKMQKEDGTYAALDALNVLADQLARMTGRKAIIFFSEGLYIQNNMFERFDFLINAANTAQTSIYTVDGRGLLTSGVADGTKGMLDSARDSSASQFGSTSGTSAWQARTMESAGQSVRMNPQEAIADLANKTGGFIVANTNDSKPGMERIAAELNQYYEVGYAPSNASGDGSLHEITLSTSRSDIQLGGPRVYLDFPDVGGAPIEAFELPLISLLNGDQLTNEFHLSNRMMRFGNDPEGIHYTLAFQVPMSSFAFATSEEAQVYQTNFSLLAMVKDSNGEVVQKISQDYPIEGPLAKMESMKAGNVLLLRSFHLAPGAYQLETGARDNLTGAMSAVREDLNVDPWPDGPGLSSVIVIDRVDPISDMSKEADNPLRYQEQKIAPNMGAAIPQDPQAQLGFYTVLYPSKDSNPPVLAMLFFKDGAPLFQGRPPLPAPDETGRIQVVLNLPLKNFAPGNYEVAVVAQQGSGVAEQRTSFQIAAP